jgi:hypothetical protein
MLAKFLQSNKYPIAILSLLGSLFGVAFSIADLKDTYDAKKRLNKKRVGTKP